MSNANVLKMILLPSISLKYIILNYTPLSVKNYFKNKKNKYTQYKRSKKFESVCLFVCLFAHMCIHLQNIFSCFVSSSAKWHIPGTAITKQIALDAIRLAYRWLLNLSKQASRCQRFLPHLLGSALHVYR